MQSLFAYTILLLHNDTENINRVLQARVRLNGWIRDRVLGWMRLRGRWCLFVTLAATPSPPSPPIPAGPSRPAGPIKASSIRNYFFEPGSTSLRQVVHYCENQFHVLDLDYATRRIVKHLLSSYSRSKPRLYLGSFTTALPCAQRNLDILSPCLPFS